MACRAACTAEYNVLVHNNELYCIDVSQAVELDHPRAFDFLREGGARLAQLRAASPLHA
jgi:serine/threonine-protein kinase RIO1